MWPGNSRRYPERNGIAMTIQQIESFLTLASTLNFTKASAMLYTTQPNLSRMLASIEQEIGAQLLVRSKRDVKLTAAGEVFQREMERAVQQYYHAIEVTKQAESGVYGSVKVGFLGTALTARLPAIVNRFREQHPGIHLQLVDYTYSLLMEALAARKIDLAVIPDRELDRLPQIAKRYLFADDMCAVVSKTHKLAAESEIDLSLLVDEPFVMMDPKVSIRDYELVTDICIEQDFVPEVAYEANTLNNLLLMVECGVGVAILAQHMTHFATENVRFIRLKGYEKFFRVSCAWHKDANPCVDSFLEVIDQCMQGELH